MFTAVLRHPWAGSTRRASRASTGDVIGWRTVLVGTSAAGVGLAAWLGHPADYLLADPDLARLLRGMALIKSSVVLGAFSAVLWRFGWPIATPTALAYAVGMAALAGSTMMIWQLTAIPLAALLFHGALIGMVCLGWRER